MEDDEVNMTTFPSPLLEVEEEEEEDVVEAAAAEVSEEANTRMTRSAFEPQGVGMVDSSLR